MNKEEAEAEIRRKLHDAARLAQGIFQTLYEDPEHDGVKLFIALGIAERALVETIETQGGEAKRMRETAQRVLGQTVTYCRLGAEETSVRVARFGGGEPS